MLEEVLEVAFRAGSAILEIYSRDDFGTTYKEGGSPLTLADSAADRVIAEGLSAVAPGVPILSEESGGAPYALRRSWKRFWMIDPLDGTKEFIKRNGEFTVNIALIDEGRPSLGVVYAPALGVAYYASTGRGAFRTGEGVTGPIRASDYRKGRLKVVASRSHRGEALERFLERLPEAELVSMGSSLKICLVAEGSAHLYPRFGPTMEWDTAAAQCVVEAAGGRVVDLGGSPLLYNKEDLANPFFIAVGNPPFPWKDCMD